jgi:hypothetical protein
LTGYRLWDLKGYRLWDMGQLDSACRAPSRGMSDWLHTYWVSSTELGLDCKITLCKNCHQPSALARSVMQSIASPLGVNGHQEPIMFPFCERHMNPPCKYAVIPVGLYKVRESSLPIIA